MAFHEPRLAASEGGTAAGRSCTVVFVGHPRRMSDRMLGVFAAEFGDTDFLRVADLEELHAARREHGDPALVILDETALDDLLERADLWAAAAAPGMLVLAYRDLAPAARLMAARDTLPALAQVGFLPLDVQIDVWLSVMRLLLCGVVVYAEALVPGAGQGPAAAGPPVPDGSLLTAREWEILELVARGKQNKIIAGELGLSEHTVKLHVHHVLRKLGVSNRTGAATWFSVAQAGGVSGPAGDADPAGG